MTNNSANREGEAGQEEENEEGEEEDDQARYETAPNNEGEK